MDSDALPSIDDDAAEIFRFEFHPEDGSERRFRVLLSPDSAALHYVRERRNSNGWHVTDAEEIDYFEYSDEDGDDAPYE